jgi:hypothetical protein
MLTPIPQNKDPRDFSMEFHLPFCALRKNNNSKDTRNLRHGRPMLARYGAPADSLNGQPYYYDGQISFLITGVDEWYWTAYFCVDTFSDDPETAEMYKDWKMDGPSAGTSEENWPKWNPREYYLMVLSQRCKQITREWEIVVYELNVVLDEYVRKFLSP